MDNSRTYEDLSLLKFSLACHRRLKKGIGFPKGISKFACTRLHFSLQQLPYYWAQKMPDFPQWLFPLQALLKWWISQVSMLGSNPFFSFNRYLCSYCNSSSYHLGLNWTYAAIPDHQFVYPIQYNHQLLTQLRFWWHLTTICRNRGLVCSWEPFRTRWNAPLHSVG